MTVFACSFCGGHDSPIVLGPLVAICDECVLLAIDYLPSARARLARVARALTFAELELLLRRQGDYDGADMARQAVEQITSRGTHRAPQAWEAIVRRDSDRDEDWRPFDRVRGNP